jgi:hypothetical protein
VSHGRSLTAEPEAQIKAPPPMFACVRKFL